MATLKQIFAIAVFASVANFVLQTLISGGYFYPKIINHAPGPCRLYDVDGAEDVQILEDGLAFFSSGTRYKTAFTCDPRILSRKGRLYIFDMNDPDKQPEELPLKSFNKTGFNPHGISLYKDKRTGVVSVFVVNHRPDAQAIEIFNFDKESKSLQLRRSIVDKKIHSPNDVIAVGLESFYVTNDHFFHFDKSFLRTLSALFLQRFLRSGVVFFDGKKSYDVAGELMSPNGISQSNDGRYIFVSAGFNPYINIYRKEADNRLTEVQSVEIGSFIDNINVNQQTGDLWLASIPKPLDFVAYNENLDHPVPARVLNIKLGKEDVNGPEPFPDLQLTEVYMNNGDELRAATGADFYGNKVAITAIYDKFLVCEVKFY